MNRINRRILSLTITATMILSPCVSFAGNEENTGDGILLPSFAIESATVNQYFKQEGFNLVENAKATEEEKSPASENSFASGDLAALNESLPVSSSAQQIFPAPVEQIPTDYDTPAGIPINQEIIIIQENSTIGGSNKNNVPPLPEEVTENEEITEIISIIDDNKNILPDNDTSPQEEVITDRQSPVDILGGLSTSAVTLVSKDSNCQSNTVLDRYLNTSVQTKPAEEDKSSVGEDFSGIMKQLYDAQKELYSEILSGNAHNSMSLLDISQTDFADACWSLEQLGITDSDLNGDKESLSEAVEKAVAQKLGLDFDSLYDALSKEGESGLFWAGEGFLKLNPNYEVFSKEDVTYIKPVSSVGFGFSVSGDFRPEPEEQSPGIDSPAAGLAKLDTSKLLKISSAVDNAKSIIESSAFQSDGEKIYSYSNAISAINTRENNSFVAQKPCEYNPWSVISVFAGDSQASPVYAHAMQFLCSNTFFSGNTSVYTVSGTIGDVYLSDHSENTHIWNIASVEGVGNYIVDTANPSSSYSRPTTGNPFYGYSFDNGSVYRYDKETLSEYSLSLLTLTNSPAEPSIPAKPSEPNDLHSKDNPINPQKPGIPADPVFPAGTPDKSVLSEKDQLIPFEPVTPSQQESSPYSVDINISPATPKNDEEDKDTEEENAPEQAALPIVIISGLDEKTVLRPGSGGIKLNIRLDVGKVIKNIMWQNSAPDIINISESGLVTVKRGVKQEVKVSITAVVTDDEDNVITQDIVLTVAPAKTPVQIRSSMNLDGARSGSVLNGKTISLKDAKGKDLNFSVILPENTEKLMWSVSDGSLATIYQSSDGTNVTLHINGDAGYFDVFIRPLGSEDEGTKFTIVLESTTTI